MTEKPPNAPPESRAELLARLGLDEEAGQIVASVVSELWGMDAAQLGSLLALTVSVLAHKTAPMGGDVGDLLRKLAEAVDQTPPMETKTQ